MSKRKKIALIASIFALLIYADPVLGQKAKKQKSVKKQRKEFLDLQEERDQASTKALEEKRSKHLKIQTKETRKRMKANKRKVKRKKKRGHSDPWIKRLFMKKGK